MASPATSRLKARVVGNGATGDATACRTAQQRGVEIAAARHGGPRRQAGRWWRWWSLTGAAALGDRLSRGVDAVAGAALTGLRTRLPVALAGVGGGLPPTKGEGC